MVCRDVSVLLSTYANDDPDCLDAAIESVVDQTVPPTQVVVMEDGPIPDALAVVVDNWADRYPDLFDVYRLTRNAGLGTALREGIACCDYELIARMDADDISLPHRFETQLDYFEAYPEVDAVGGYIEEFTESGETETRTVPLSPADIRSHARFRSPMNHVTVMFRKEAVLSAGNYRATDPLEDYDLWTRMLKEGRTLANVPETLVRVRAGENMYDRRGGASYLRSELKLQTRLLQSGFVSPPVFLLNVAVRTGVRLVPNMVRGVVYRRLLRK